MHAGGISQSEMDAADDRHKNAKASCLIATCIIYSQPSIMHECSGARDGGITIVKKLSFSSIDFMGQ